MIADADRTDADGRSGINQIADFQRKETADIGNDLVYWKEHICCISLLYRLSVNVQMKR